MLLMWLIPALFCLFSSCFMTVWNQHIRMPALQLNLVRCIVLSVMFGVTLPFIEWPQGWGFYSGALIAGIASMVTSTSLFYGAKEHSAHLASLFMPLAMIFTFAVWLFIGEGRLAWMADHPINAALIAAAMVIANVTVVKMRHIRFTHTSFIGLVVLNAVMIALSQIWVKETTENKLDAVLMLSFIIFITQVICSFGWMKFQALPIAPLRVTRNIMVLSVVSALSCMASWYAVLWAPDPSYYTAVLLAAPFMLMLYHRAKGHDISQSLIPGAIITCCSLVIVLFSL